MSGFAQQSTQANRDQDADNPKGRSGPEMGDVISRLESLANEASENRTDHGRDCERKKIHPARGTSFYFIRIGFLDDGIGNHGGAGSDAEDESGQLRRHECG